MIELEVYNKLAKEDNQKIPVYSFKSCYKINIIMGDSGTGKSLFFSYLTEALRNTGGWSYKCTKNIGTISSIDEFEESINNIKIKEKVFIMDEDIVQIILKRKLVDKINKSPNYFIIIDRGLGTSLETNVKALFKIEATNKMFKGIQIFNINSYINIDKASKNSKSELNFNKFNMLLTEDSESGRIFFKTLLDKLKIYEGNADSKGRYLGGKSSRSKSINYYKQT